MFTGLVEGVGRVITCEHAGDGRVLRIEAPWLGKPEEGESIAVDGACLTAVSPGRGRFDAVCSEETLAKTTLGRRLPGDLVNLERAMRVGDRIGGHLVTGHVDAVTRVVAIEHGSSTQRWRIALPTELARFVAVKGSVTVDGVSLTVNHIDDEAFGVTLIPHTLASTTLGRRRTGDDVNLEIDLVARYLARQAEAPA